jgi:hypothetical protein
VLSVIIYTDAIYQKKERPMVIESATGNSSIIGTFKEIVLSEMSEQQLIDIDPRLVILVPSASVQFTWHISWYGRITFLPNPIHIIFHQYWNQNGCSVIFPAYLLLQKHLPMK